MRKIILALTIVITLMRCSGTLLDKETESRIKQLTACESVTTGWAAATDSKTGATKTLKLTIHEPKNVDAGNKDEVEPLAVQVAATVFDKVEKIDTTYTSVEIVFVSGKGETSVDFAIDELLAGIGAQYFEAGEHEKGISYLTRAIKMHPTAKLIHNRGAQFYALKQFDNALTDFNKAYELEPENPVRLTTIISCYLQMGEMDKARAITEKAIKMNPALPHGYSTRARFLYGAGKLDSAAQDLEKAISIDSTVSTWQKELSQVYFESNEMGKALNAITKYVEREHEDGMAYLLQGKILLKMHKRTEACASFTLAGKLGEKESETYIKEACK